MTSFLFFNDGHICSHKWCDETSTILSGLSISEAGQAFSLREELVPWPVCPSQRGFCGGERLMVISWKQIAISLISKFLTESGSERFINKNLWSNSRIRLSVCFPSKIFIAWTRCWGELHIKVMGHYRSRNILLPLMAHELPLQGKIWAEKLIQKSHWLTPPQLIMNDDGILSCQEHIQMR